MRSIFSELPNDIIISIIRIENDRRKYEEVVKQFNKITTHDEFCPSIRSTFNRGGDGLSVSDIWVGYVG